MWWALAVGAIVGYLIGSVQFGLIVGRVTRGVDIRDYGSGATGATNVIRTSGAKAGVLVIFLDVAKGIAPVYIGIGIGHLAGVDHRDDRAWIARSAPSPRSSGMAGPCTPAFAAARAWPPASAGAPRL